MSRGSEHPPAASLRCPHTYDHPSTISNIVYSRQDRVINTAPHPTRNDATRRRAVFTIAAIAGLVLTACSDSKSLSSATTLAPLITADEPVTTVTIPIDPTSTTGVEITVATVAPSATTLPTATTNTMTPATMTPPSLVPPNTVAPETVPVSSPDTVPVETDPSATAPPDTTPPTVPPGSCDSCRADYRFPYATFFDVPQLGSEPVRGSGCGANGSIGEVIPDGYWDGHISVSGSTLKIDLQCVYYGDSAKPYVDQCIAANGEDDCLEYGTDFWIINNNTRKRSVTLDPSFRRRYASPDGCGDPGPGHGATAAEGSQTMDSWIVIEGGLVTFALTSCVYG